MPPTEWNVEPFEGVVSVELMMSSRKRTLTIKIRVAIIGALIGAGGIGAFVGSHYL